MRAAIGERHGAALAETYQRMITPGPYRPDAQSAGRRALKNVCLDLLAMTETSDAIARAFAQYQSADNMTDRMAALETLAQHDRPERAAALDDFYRRYADDPLIIDKWLALQAAIPEPATLDRVRALTDTSGLFDGQSQPRALADRRVRAGQPHPVQPRSTAPATISSPTSCWRSIRRTRRSPRASWAHSAPGARSKRDAAARAEAALRRVAATPSLSRDVHDIVARTLADN